MMRKSIDALIEQVLKTTEHDVPGDIADDVVRLIKTTDYKVYLKQLVLHRVSSVAGRMREKVNPVKAGVSTKQRLIREKYWPQFLATKVALPAGYKTMGELTADDLDWLAGFRRTQANELIGKAVQFERLALMMREKRVAVLEQLPHADGEQVLAA